MKGKPRRIAFILPLLASIVSPSLYAEDIEIEYEPTPTDVVAASDHLARTEYSQRLQPLGLGLMGDQIDPHTGALVFSVTDLEVPGNNDLEVAIRRTARSAAATNLGTSQSSRRETALADWQLDVPYISNLREKPSTGVTRLGVLCRLPESDAAGFSNGMTLNIPGQPSKVLMDSQPAPPLVSAPFLTKDYWIADCDASTGRFTVTAPNGDEYTMSHAAVVSALPFDTKDYLRNPQVAQRVEGRLYATEVKDVSGNWVRYRYTADGKLTRIHSNDGRRIDITYHSGTKNIATVRSAGRVWRYTYRNTSSSRVLSSVELPDGTFWTYDIWRLTEEKPGNLAPGPIQVHHPYGALATYDMRRVVHTTHRVVYRDARGRRREENSEEENLAVISKTLTGAYLQSASWRYTYEENVSHGYSRTKTRWVKEQRPDGSVLTRNTYLYGLLQGMTKSEEVRPSLASNSVLERRDYEYFEDSVVGRIEVLEGSISYAKLVTPVHLAKMTETANGDARVEQRTYAQGGLGLVRSKRVETAAGTRVSDYTYESLPGRWIIGLLVAETVNGKELVRNEYDSLGRRTKTAMYGLDRFTYGYHVDPGQQGSFAWTEDALGRKTEFDDFKRGIPQEVTLPDRSRIVRVVDDNGWVVKETNGRSHTSEYSYNGVGWLTRISPPASFVPTTITYGSKTAGVLQTINQGPKRTVVKYDVLHRPVQETVIAMSGGGQSTYKRTMYDGLGRTTFQSFPSTSQSAVSGILTSYDGLGRPTEKLENVAPFAKTTFAYLAGNRRSIEDAAGNTTVYTFDGFEGPGEGALIRIEQPLGVSTVIQRDAWGKVTRLRQFGSGAGGSVDQSQYFRYDDHFRLCYHRQPETGVALYRYDDMDNLVLAALGAAPAAAGSGCGNPDAGTGRITNRYDARNRPIFRKYMNSSSIAEAETTNRYDFNGNLISTVNRHVGGEETEIRYSYNEVDRLTEEVMNSSYEYIREYDEDGSPVMEQPTYRARYHYNGSGDLTGMDTPMGRSVSYTLNGLGQVTELEAIGLAGSVVASASAMSYHPDGSLKSITYGNGLTTEYEQDARMRVSSMRVGTSGRSVVDLTYSRDAMGRITSELDAVNPTENRGYGYDALGRLVSASGPWGAGAFTYDALGNLRRKVLGSRTIDVEYNSINRVRRVRDTAHGASWRNYAHDQRGNVTDNGEVSMDYGNAYPLPVSIGPRGANVSSGRTLSYDGYGRRALEVDPLGPSGGGATASFYSQEGTLMTVDRLRTSSAFGGGSHTEYIYAGGRAVGRVLFSDRGRFGVSESVEYMHVNHLGSPLAGTSGTGQVNWRESYTPYGERVSPSSANDDELGYAGHVQESGGMVYMQARYYDPRIGRFLSQDPIGFKPSKPHMFNRYAYVGGDPVNRRDPFGMESYDDLEEEGEGKKEEKDEAKSRGDDHGTWVITVDLNGFGKAALGVVGGASAIVKAVSFAVDIYKTAGPGAAAISTGVFHLIEMELAEGVLFHAHVAISFAGGLLVGMSIDQTYTAFMGDTLGGDIADFVYYLRENEAELNEVLDSPAP